MGFFRLAAFLFAANFLLFSQTAATLAGTVRDTSGGVVPGVVVTVTQTATGLVRKATTGRDGLYQIPSLGAGVIEVRATAAGFRPLVRKGIELTVNESAKLDLELAVGSVDQEVTVSAAASQVNTTTPELGYLVSESSMRDLPLNGRNYTDLALLQPGVVAYPHRDGGSVVAHGLGVSINGQDPRSNVYLIDGTPQNDFTNGPAGSAAGTALGVESIREFRVEVNNYSAEFGRNAGGQFNALTKSGSNELHGSLYHFLRNDNFDARNFFDPAKRPEFKRNQFGGSLGGPIRKDKDFFFFTYEGLRDRLGRTIVSAVPDDNARRGILPDPANPGQTLTVPVNAAVQPFLNEMPRANGNSRGGGLADYIFGFAQSINQHFVQGRYDRNFGNSGQFFTRYTFDDAVQNLPTDFPQFPRQFLSKNQFVTTEYRHVVSARTLLHFRGSFSRTTTFQNVEANTATQLPEFVTGRGLTGNIDIGGMPRFGPQSSANLRLTQNVYGFEAGATLTRGRHMTKIGMLSERYQDNMVNPTFSLGGYTFNDLRSFLTNTPARFLGLTPQGQFDRYWRYTLMGFYVQDSWRIHPRLTINPGLRYEFATMPRDLYGRDSALMNLFTDSAPVSGQLYQNPTKKNFSPRFGFAWDVFGTGKTAVRGGYGLIYNTNAQQTLIVTVTNPPYTPRVSITNPTFPNPPFERGLGNTIRPVEWNIKNPYMQTWNLNLQQELPGGVVVTAGYAGSRGIHLLRSNDVNIVEPVRQADGTLVFPAGAPRRNPAFTTIELKSSDGNSWYHAGILEVRKRLGRDLQFQSSYTFARNIDTTQASTFFSDATNGTTSAMPEFAGFSYNKGLSDYHAKHNWVTNFHWDIPLFRNAAGVKKAALAGWQLAGISNMRSGGPLTAFVSGNRSRSGWSPSLGPGLGQDRPSLAAGFTHESAVLGNPTQWFNPAAFVMAPAGQLGTLGRGTFIGPNLRTFDLSLLKNFALSRWSDQARLQFRAESFNLFNRANFGVPNLLAISTTTGAIGTFGQIRNTITTARQIQLGLRLQF
ncbi:MAG TPA: TonB-dependent receptor [Bryobacteraceae bacterium]|nr:TonB-dependent receptor [Bryobacteraceae bacterium]